MASASNLSLSAQTVTDKKLIFMANNCPIWHELRSVLIRQEITEKNGTERVDRPIFFGG
jgi:hypothetical protein